MATVKGTETPAATAPEATTKTCMAPLDGFDAAAPDKEGKACGKTAPHEREAGGLVFSLCAPHAAEVDADPEE